MKKKEVIVKNEKMFGREGISIYIDGVLSRNVTKITSLFEELKLLTELEIYNIIFK